MILHRIDDNVCIGSFALDEAAYPLSLSQCSPTSIHPSNAGSQSLSLSPMMNWTNRVLLCIRYNKSANKPAYII